MPILALAAGLALPQPKPLPLAAVDLPRMQGTWYIVATIPNAFERGMVEARDVYREDAKGGLREDFYIRRGAFSRPQKHYVTTVGIQPNTSNADWRVHILGFISLPFEVVHVDPDYRFALFGEKGRDLGWVYSRSQTISDADYGRMMKLFAGAGYDVARFKKVVQTPAELGQPGFWNDGLYAVRAPAAAQESE